MPTVIRRAACTLACGLACLLVYPRAPSADPVADGTVDFNRQVRPILTAKCFTCHGPDDKERKADLRLDTRKGALAERGETRTRAIVPGDPLKSELVRRISTSDPEDHMPPPRSGKKLSADEIKTLRRWVEQGAPYAEHWSHVKPDRPEVPRVSNAAWPRNAIDVFILERLEKAGLGPSPEADRYALVRRLSLDLAGLPPTIEEVDAFVNDPAPDAYDRLVTRLLDSGAYGEHWARMWLDLARYADSAGYADDPPREIWGYRDWVIRAFNSNLPFDRFTIEQLAGDLLPDPREDQLVATAFHRNTQTNSEGGTDDEEFRNVAVVDRVNTTMAVWMGTTMACAQCHNHKYDPIRQEDYFRLFAFFNQTEDADKGDESPRIPITVDAERRQRVRLEENIAALEAKLRAPTPELLASQAAWERSFPRELSWATPRPSRAVSRAGAKLETLSDGSVLAAALALENAQQDSLTIELPVETSTLRAVRIDAIPHDSLPGKGPGQGKDGGFEVSRVKAVLAAPGTAHPGARFVRLELPGKGRYLHIAEVQVLSGGENVALRGEAKQINTDYNGPAEHAIDGKTDGNYDAGSTTHTRLEDNPWWEVDLKAAFPIERVIVWNRTDSALQSRLDGFRIQLLGEKREVAWQSEPQKGPPSSVALEPGGERTARFSAAILAGARGGSDAASVLKAGAQDNTQGNAQERGWIGGGGPSSLTLIAPEPVEAPPGSKLAVTIESGSKEEPRTLGRFRVRLTDHAGAAEWARTPPSVVQALLAPASERAGARSSEVTRHFLETVAPELEPVRKDLRAARKELADLKPFTVPILRELAEGQRRKTWIQYRGNFLDRGPEVTPGVPAAFHALKPDAPVDRLALARWLVDENNPLTARVTVNRYWEKIFGIGLVATSEEFGAQGEPPSHPELLDWLATELVGCGWDLKYLLRLLVTSASYRQASRVAPELLERDPENRLVSRGPRFRLPAETIRDEALFASGLLSRKMYGPPVKPPQPSSGLSAAFGSAIDWQTSSGEDRYRRGLYVTWRRSNPYPSLSTFDATNREVCTIRRARTNTPLQALVTLNDPVYVEAAQALARRMAAEGGPAPADRARLGFRLCLARAPADPELTRLVRLHAEARERFAKDLEAARKLATDPLGPLPDGGDAVDLAAWTVVANVLLNLDEMFLCR